MVWVGAASLVGAALVLAGRRQDPRTQARAWRGSFGLVALGAVGVLAGALSGNLAVTLGGVIWSLIGWPPLVLSMLAIYRERQDPDRVLKRRSNP